MIVFELKFNQTSAKPEGIVAFIFWIHTFFSSLEYVMIYVGLFVLDFKRNDSKT